MELLIAILFGIIFIAIPFFISRRGAKPKQGGNSTSLVLIFVFSVVSSGYGWVSGAGDVYAKNGAVSWLYLSLPYFLWHLILLFIFNKTKKVGSYEDLAELVAAKRGRLFMKLCLPLILIINSPAMYIHMGAGLVSVIFGIPKYYSVLIVALMSSLHLFNGGFGSVLKNDTLKFVFMYSGFILSVVYLFYRYPETGDVFLNSDFFNIEIDWNYFLSWFCLAIIVVIDPANYQRFSYAKNNRLLKKGIALAFVFWIIFDLLLMFTAGFTNTLSPATNSGDIYFTMATSFLTPPLFVFVVIALMSAFVSTADSLIYSSATTLYHTLRPSVQAKPEKKLLRTSVAAITLVNIALVFVFINDSVVDLLFAMFPPCIAVLSVPVLIIYFEKTEFPSRIAIIHLLATAAFALLWFVVNRSVHLLKDEHGAVLVLTTCTFSLLAYLILRKRRTRISRDS